VCPAPDPSQAPGPSPSDPVVPDGATPSREVVEALVRECDGNVSEIARRVGRERRQVYRWLHRFGLKEREGS
jgi:transcriptional regulator of acetoin/glycerol metabolism